MEDTPVISLSEEFYTNFSGINRLFKFYHEAVEHYNTTIYLDFYHLKWFDANLTALFGSILSKLTKENNLVFSTDLNFLEDKFNILFRNGFLSPEREKNGSSIYYKSFDTTHEVEFINYIRQDLLTHQGMPELTESQQTQILDSLIEVFNNIQIHSKSEHPFFVCGQYYPTKKQVAFSMVDLGVGFLPAIVEKTNGTITNDYDAIKWALEKGNSSRSGTPSGIGLYRLQEHFKNNGGNFQIITGSTYWSLDLEKTMISSYKIQQPYVGSMLNLLFNCN